MIRYVELPYAIVSRQTAPGSATRKGSSATSANCLSATASASTAAASTTRRRESNAKASTTHRRDGASAVPNQAARTASGFAASTAPSAIRNAIGARKTNAAKKSATVHNNAKKR